MPGGVLQQNTLYSGLLITDKQDRVNEKIMLEFLKKRGGTCMNSNIITKVQIQTQNINKLWFIILCGMPYRRNSKTWRWSIRQQELSHVTLWVPPLHKLFPISVNVWKPWQATQCLPQAAEREPEWQLEMLLPGYSIALLVSVTLSMCSTPHS